MSWILNNFDIFSGNFLNYFRIDEGIENPFVLDNRAPAAGAMRLDYDRAIPVFSPEITQHVFGFLSPHQMGDVRRVCREYRYLGEEKSLRALSGDLLALETWYPNSKIIAPEVWYKYADCQILGIDPTGAFQPTPRALGEVISSFYHQVEDKAGVTVFTLPKGLTLNKLLMIARRYGVPELFVSREILQQFGDEAVAATCIQVISNSILKNSRNKSFLDQQVLCRGLGCEIPDIVTSLAFIILSYLESSDQPGARFFGALSLQRRIYARNLQQIRGQNLIVSLASQSNFYGLDVLCGTHYASENIGVMALWKKDQK